MGQKSAPKTPPPRKTIRQQKSNTFLAKRSPFPVKITSTSSSRKRIQSPLLGHKDSMSFRSRSRSPLRTAHRQVSPQRGRLAQHRLSSPSKSCLAYESPARTGHVRLSDLKGIPDKSRPQTTATPTQVTMENTRLNTPTSPSKWSPSRSRTPASPTKPISARSQSPASSSKFCSSLMSPFTTEPSALIRAKEAHAHAVVQKAAEVAELKRKNLDMLAQKKFEDEESLKIKKSEIAMKRQVSHSALRCPAIGNLALKGPALNNLALKTKVSQSALRSPALGSPALLSLQSPALNKPRVRASRLPVFANKESKLPVLAKKESTEMMGTPIGGLVVKPTSSTATGMMTTRTPTATGLPSGLKPKDSKPSLRSKPSHIGMAAGARGASQLQPKDSMSLLRERPIQIGLGQMAKNALPTPKPVAESKLRQKIESPQ